MYIDIFIYNKDLKEGLVYLESNEKLSDPFELKAKIETLLPLHQV